MRLLILLLPCQTFKILFAISGNPIYIIFSQYNGGVANVKDWKISCYLEVMDGGVPCTNPNLDLRAACLPLLERCDYLFMEWYKQQHSCNGRRGGDSNIRVARLMTFIVGFSNFVLLFYLILRHN